MKYLSGNFKLLTLLLALFVSFNTSAQYPERPNPPRLVNDFAGMLQPDQRANLERELVAFDNQTTTQIAIVTVKDLNGSDAASYAFELAQKWGIGNKGSNNGILILIKPKTDTKGEVFIATGYGVEGAVPDALAKRIVQVEIIPNFIKGDYYGGITAATKTLMSLTKGEFTADQYYAKHKKKKSNSSYIFFIIIAVVLVIIISSAKSKSNQYRNSSMTSGLPWWMLLTMLNSGSRGSSFGDFSSGGGDFGSGGDSFGGFGGGDFGGGGAGGSW
jgi:uncharacterized protein